MILNSRSNRILFLAGGIIVGIAIFAAVVGEKEPQWRRLDDVALDPPRRGLSMALLPDGKVLIAGGTTVVEMESGIPGVPGFTQLFIKKVEIYDPETNRCTPAAPFHFPLGHEIFLPIDDGRILALGRGPAPFRNCEIYDARTGKWTATGSMLFARPDSGVVRLANGHILVAGGRDDGKNYAECQLYDPATGTWRKAASLSKPRSYHYLVALQDGPALLIDGANSECERYDPATDRWSAAAPPHNLHGSYALAIALKNGKVLLAGGMRFTGGDHPRADPNFTSEVYNPKNDKWTAAARVPVALSRNYFTAHLLGDGRVLVISADTERTCLLYHPGRDRWHKIPTLNTPRFDHASVVLADGRVLVGGGYKGGSGPESQLGDFEILEWD